MADRSASIRNVALVGHGDTGKTTFAEHALHKGGAVSRAGSVPTGTTLCDWDDDEKDRGHSIDVTPCHLDWKGKTLQLVDCPGYPDFSGVAVAGMWAMDTALLFVSAVNGLGVNTRRMWRAADVLGKARIVVISKCDIETANPETVLDAVQQALGSKCLPFNQPDGKGKAFTRVVSCFDPEAAGPTLTGDPETARGELIEAIAEADDDLLMRYLEGETLPQEDVAEGLRTAIRSGTVVPVLFLSSTTGVGLTELLDFVAEYAPGADRPMGAKLDGEGAIESASGDFAASVFKITSDVHVGKQSFLRVWRGSLPADGTVANSASDGTLKIAHPTRPQGKERSQMSSVGPGEVFCVAKVEELRLCETVAAPAGSLRVTSPPFMKSMVQVAVTPKARGEDHKIAIALDRMSDEDPSLTAERHAETNELVVAGRSSLHLDVVMKRIKRRFRLEMDSRVPRVPLKETVLARADGHHRHKKQTGGRGQFGEVFLRIAPKERGTGFEFLDKTVGGSIPRNFMPAIEKGIRETMERGVIAGYLVVDVVVEVYDGKHHPVDSSEAAFKMAGSKAFRDAFDKAKPVLLEPIMAVEIDVPSKHMGDISGDLNTRRGRITGMDTHGDHQVIKAHVPLIEVQTYSQDLRSMTSGEGMYTLEESHLDVVPSNVAQKLIAKYAAIREAEEH